VRCFLTAAEERLLVCIIWGVVCAVWRWRWLGRARTTRSSSCRSRWRRVRAACVCLPFRTAAAAHF